MTDLWPDTLTHTQPEYASRITRSVMPGVSWSATQWYVDLMGITRRLYADNPSVA